ncbi:MAG: hypothetical protein CL985_02580 [Euryarchaeota archaeon]|nr:hypothetical protein [Euryarchaeota archaeon]
MNPLLETVLVSMRDAFLAVTVFVAVMVLLFSWLQYLTAGRFVDWIRSRKKWQPVIGALMGLIPGCGGAIIIMPMFAKGYVTYGTVLATLIATLGDSAFVLFGAVIQDDKFLTPVLVVHLISFLAGVIWGYGADMLSITPENPIGSRSSARSSEHSVDQLNDQFEEFEHGDIISELAREEPGTLSYKIVHNGYKVWWLVTISGLILGVLLIFWLAQDPDYNPELSADLSTRDGILTVIGVTGTLLSLVLYAAGKSFIADDTEASIGDKLHSFDETLTHAASETAFVTVWVLVAYLLFEGLIVATGISESDLAAGGDGPMAVAVAASIGLIPGCGPQIIAFTAYVEGIFSFPALVANAISQDGDALFPLLVRHRTASLWATIHTLLPGLICGMILLSLGIDLP